MTANAITALNPANRVPIACILASTVWVISGARWVRIGHRLQVVCSPTQFQSQLDSIAAIVAPVRHQFESRYAATIPDSRSPAISRSHTMIWFQLGVLRDTYRPRQDQ
ncbi:uncharacterized protein METZ01_LOCUS122260 [marine metagenome]|uniref:Uncharacterized protein n=1 Tax=marine metagenome TaxID=408172 RepID=A0A381XX97_9ZZZZ